MLVGGVALPSVTAGPATAGNDVGFRDFSYGSSVSAPTAEKAQSKLWFLGGSWWGALYSTATKSFNIHRLDRSTQVWTDTGVLVDGRTRAKIDALWNGTHLYIAAAGQSATAAGDSAMVSRFSFSNGQFTRDPGYPVTLVTGGMDSIVIDQDSTGRLWATWVRDTSVYVTHSTTTDASWVTPYVLPVPGANDVKPEPDGDSSTLVSFGGKIGVLWGNQNTSSPSGNSYWFAIHRDGTDDSAGSWTRELAYGGVPSQKNADDHMNIKSLQSDEEGRVVAAVKTSLTTSSSPLIVLLVRQPDGTWDRDNVYGRAGENHTRAIVLLDDENNEAHVFAAAPCCSGGVIYHKKASFQALLNGNPFAGGLGAPFISSSLDVKINNPTSTKQTLNSRTGLVVLAGDDGTRRYLHNTIDLRGSGATVPDTTILSGPSGSVTSTEASFTFASTVTPATFECSLDSAPFTGCTSPQAYTGLGGGSHRFEVRAVTSGGADPTPAIATWTVDVAPPPPPPPPPPPAPVTMTLAATADANVQESAPSTNFGTTTQLLADTTPKEESYLRFSLPDDGRTIASATLRLFVTNGTPNGPTLHTVADQTWTEAGITWSTRPARSSTVLGDTAAIKNNTWIEYDVTSAVTGPGAYGFALVPESADRLVANSREATKNTPVLVVTYADTTAPEVTGRSPLDGATAVPVGEPVTATFSEPMDPAAVAAAMSLAGPTGPVPSTITYDDASRTGTLSPGVELAGDTTYRATVSTAATDVAGNRLAADTTWAFTTAAAVDTTPPQTTIAGGPAGTVRDATASFTFTSSEADSVFSCSLDGAEPAPCVSPATYQALAEGPHTFAVAATDRAGNTDPSPAERTWTVDLTAPTIDGASPAPGATGVPVTGTVSATFSEAMDPTSLSAAMSLSGPGGAVPAVVSYDAQSRTATLSPTGTLAAATTYTAAVGTSARDVAGNPLAAAATWTFATAAAPPPPSGPLDDGFESGDFAAWSTVRVGADGTASVLPTGGVGGTRGAALSATTTTGSLAYIRKTFDATADLTVELDIAVTREGASGSNVPLLRLFDSSGGRTLSVFRQNLSANRIYVTDGDVANALTTGRLPLDTWARVRVSVSGAGTGAARLEVSLDGVVVYSAEGRTLPSVAALQVGNETARQAFALTADNVRATIP